MSVAATYLLQDFNLRNTTQREEILEIFLDNNHALSHADIEKKVGNAIDRVTVYRTLKTFLNKGVVHKVLDDCGVIKYALCKNTCTTHKHSHDHAHFKCVECGVTNCLENVVLPHINIPDGYEKLESNFLMIGICDQCNKAT